MLEALRIRKPSINHVMDHASAELGEKRFQAVCYDSIGAKHQTKGSTIRPELCYRTLATLRIGNSIILLLLYSDQH